MTIDDVRKFERGEREKFKASLSKKEGELFEQFSRTHVSFTTTPEAGASRLMERIEGAADANIEEWDEIIHFVTLVTNPKIGRARKTALKMLRRKIMFLPKEVVFQTRPFQTAKVTVWRKVKIAD